MRDGGTHFSAVVLAAGLSRRMQGPNKLLLDVGGEPAIRRTVRALLGAKPIQTLVVTGFGSADVMRALGGLPVDFVLNPHFEAGQQTSVIAGIKALSQPCDAFLVCLGDMVLLAGEDYLELMTAYFRMQSHSILVPFFEDRRANPVLFPGRFVAEVRAGRHDQGLRHYIEQHPGEICRHPVHRDAYTIDLDTPLDYVRVIEHLKEHPGETGLSPET